LTITFEPETLESYNSALDLVSFMLYIANVIDYDYIESNHICLETSSQRKENHLHGLL